MKDRTDQISVDVAYRAMLIFWNEIFKRTESTEIGIQLEECLLLQDGGSADPARKNDYLSNVKDIIANPDREEIFLHIT